MKKIFSFILLAFFVFIGRSGLSADLNTLYAQSALITIDNSMVSGASDLSNFVLLISLDANNELRDTGNGGDIESNGLDIVFSLNADDDETLIYKHDLESYNGTTGELVMWVQITTLSASSNTTLTMSYGRASAPDLSDNSLWSDANYIGVWQLSEAPGTSTVIDATGNSANGSTFGDVAVDASSVVGQGYSFDGTGDYVTIPRNATIEPTGSFTISCWFKTNVGPQNDYAKMFSKGRLTAPYGSYTLEMRPVDDNPANNHDDEVGFQTGRQNGNLVLTDSNGNGIVDINAGDWNYFAGVIDDPGGPNITQRFYLNGDEISSSTAENTSSIDHYGGAYDLTIGGIYDGGINNEFDGTIDELRIASGVRTEDYLRTEVRNTACVSNYMTIAGITGLSCTDVSLPVQLKEFVGQRNGQNIDLQWITSSEENNDYFSIEKSFDGKSFYTIGMVKGSGNSSETVGYAYTDHDVSQNLVYYRLKQTDFDGSFEYSRIEKVFGRKQGKSTLTAYPNPSLNGLITLTYSDSGSGSVLIYIRNLSGQIVHRELIETSTSDYFSKQLDLSILPKGSYIVNIIGKQSSMSEKIFLR